MPRRSSSVTSPVTGSSDPALGRLAQHDRLRIEPPALVEQAAKFAAILAVLLDGVLVVDSGNEPLVGDIQQSKPGSLVDAAGSWLQ